MAAKKKAAKAVKPDKPKLDLELYHEDGFPRMPKFLKRPGHDKYEQDSKKPKK